MRRTAFYRRAAAAAFRWWPYPYPEGHDYPADAEHLGYQLDYNTPIAFRTPAARACATNILRRTESPRLLCPGGAAHPPRSATIWSHSSYS